MKILFKTILLLAIFQIIANKIEQLLPWELNYHSWTITDLNFRESPEIDNNILSIVPKGSQIEIISYDSKWTQAKYHNQIGYLATRFIRTKQIKSSEIALSILIILQTIASLVLAITSKHSFIGSILYFANKLISLTTIPLALISQLKNLFRRKKQMQVIQYKHSAS